MLQTQIEIPKSDFYRVGKLEFRAVSNKEVLDYIETNQTKFVLEDKEDIIPDRKIKLIFEGADRTNKTMLSTMRTLESANLIRFWMPAGYNPEEKTIRSNSLTEAYVEKYMSYVIDHLIPKDEKFYILLYDTSR